MSVISRGINPQCMASTIKMANDKFIIKARPHRARSRSRSLQRDWFPLVNSLVVATPNAFCIATSQCRARFAKCQKKRERGRVFGVAGALNLQ